MYWDIEYNIIQSRIWLYSCIREGRERLHLTRKIRKVRTGGLGKLRKSPGKSPRRGPMHPGPCSHFVEHRISTLRQQQSLLWGSNGAKSSLPNRSIRLKWFLINNFSITPFLGSDFIWQPFNRFKLPCVLAWKFAFMGSPSIGPHPKVGPRLESHTLELFQILAISRIQSRCFLETACLPVELPHPIPHPTPALCRLAYWHTLGQPWGPEQMFPCACLPAPSPGTHMCIHAHTHTPAAWVVPNYSWISCHNRGCLPLPSSSFIPQIFPHLSTAWTFMFPHPLSYTPAQDRLNPTRVLRSLWESNMKGRYPVPETFSFVSEYHSVLYWLGLRVR